MDERMNGWVCAFCGRGAGEVWRLIAGRDGVCICSDCVLRGHRLIEAERLPATRQRCHGGASSPAPPPGAVARLRRLFSRQGRASS